MKRNNTKEINPRRKTDQRRSDRAEGHSLNSTHRTPGPAIRGNHQRENLPRLETRTSGAGVGVNFWKKKQRVGVAMGFAQFLQG